MLIGVNHVLTPFFDNFVIFVLYFYVHNEAAIVQDLPL